MGSSCLWWVFFPLFWFWVFRWWCPSTSRSVRRSFLRTKRWWFWWWGRDFGQIFFVFSLICPYVLGAYDLPASGKWSVPWWLWKMKIFGLFFVILGRIFLFFLPLWLDILGVWDFLFPGMWFFLLCDACEVGKTRWLWWWWEENFFWVLWYPGRSFSPDSDDVTHITLWCLDV